MAEKYFKKSLEIREKKLGKDHKDTATSYKNMGKIFFERKDYFVALDFYVKGFEVNKKLFGLNHPKITSSLNSIGEV